MSFDISFFGLSKSSLPEGWVADRLDSLCEFNPYQVSNNYKHKYIYYLDISNVYERKIGEPILLQIDEAPSRAKRIVKANDTIISTVRPGNKAYFFFKNPLSNLIVSTGFAVLKPKECDPRFLYYLSTSPPIIDYLTSIAEEKTAYPSVNPCDIAECIVPIPSLSEQKAIGQILGSLDDKIELNNRMNHTLEAMAKAIFKSWFVDFDPVIDNALEAGNVIPDDLAERAAMRRDLGDHRKPLPDEIRLLFPARFVESELGWIPEGWEVNNISSMSSKIEYGLSKSALKEKTPYKFLRITDIQGGQVNWNNVPYCIVSDKKVEQYKIRNGDIFIARTGASTGENIYIHKPPQSLFASYLIRFQFKDISVAKYVSIAMRLEKFFEFVSNIIGGSAQPNANAKMLSSFKIIEPNLEILQKFYKIVFHFDEKIYWNNMNYSVLLKIREYLIPKLLSGKIRIPDAVVITEKAL